MLLDQDRKERLHDTIPAALEDFLCNDSDSKSTLLQIESEDCILSPHELNPLSQSIMIAPDKTDAARVATLTYHAMLK